MLNVPRIFLAVLTAALAVSCPAGETNRTEYQRLNPFKDRWYSHHLVAADEHELGPTRVSEQEVVRFLWLRSFHAPIIIRAEKTHGSYSLQAKRLSGEGGYSPGVIVFDTSFAITADDWDRLVDLLNDANFWNLKPDDVVLRDRLDRCKRSWRYRIGCSPPEMCGVGVDGAMWILEYAQPERYHAVDRWTSDVTGPYREASLELLELSGIEVPESLIY